jgi:hypothetical protein
VGDRAKDRLANASHLRTMSSIGSIMKKLQRKAGMQAKVASSGPRPRPSANLAAAADDAVGIEHEILIHGDFGHYRALRQSAFAGQGWAANRLAN